MSKNLYLAMLHKIGISQKKLHLIFSDNQNYDSFYNNLSSSTLKKYGFSGKQIDFFLENKNKYSLELLEKTINKRKVSIFTIFDDEYPDFLKEISNPPFLFYLRGKLEKGPKFAVVGSRKITDYGKNVIKKTVGEISNYFTIISGGAAGCDTFAHKSAIENGNKTISVIGTGIDVDYPVDNKKLYNNIVETGGGVISIFPVGEVGNPYNFPVRNEIVAGLSVGVLVVEAKKKSGTLITSNLALDMGKDLFAIPGDINKLGSEGCNMLIKKGMAKLVSCSNDVLEEYNITDKFKLNNNINKVILNDETEKEIYNILLLESLTIDELIIKTGFDMSSLTFKLSMMEINSSIKKGFGGKYEVF